MAQMAQEALSSAKSGAHAAISDGLARVRLNMQELHKALSDAAAKRGGATKADLEMVAEKTRTAVEQAKSAITAQSQAGKTLLTEAVALLNSTQKTLAEAEKASGQALQTKVKQVGLDIRAAVQKASEAVAAARSAASTQPRK